MSTGPRPSFNPSAHGYLLHHQHSSEHNLSQRPTTSHTIASNNSSFNDVNRRIVIATSTMSKLSLLWTSSRLSLALKMRLYNSRIISIITYSSASWNPQTTSKCLRTHLPSATRHSSHRHSDLHPTFIMAPPKRTPTSPQKSSKPPRCP